MFNRSAKEVYNVKLIRVFTELYYCHRFIFVMLFYSGFHKKNPGHSMRVEEGSFHSLNVLRNSCLMHFIFISYHINVRISHNVLCLFLLLDSRSENQYFV
jgi:hypothetical protein